MSGFEDVLLSYLLNSALAGPAAAGGSPGWRRGWCVPAGPLAEHRVWVGALVLPGGASCGFAHAVGSVAHRVAMARARSCRRPKPAWPCRWALE